MPADHPELRRRLGRRAAELSDEIRHYPTPIARCDEQLADLLERRARVFALLGRLDGRRAPRGGCSSLAAWVNDGGVDGA